MCKTGKNPKLLSTTQIKKLWEYLEKELNLRDINPDAHDPDNIRWECDQTMKHAIKWMYDNKIKNINQNIRHLKRSYGARCDCTILLNVHPSLYKLAKGMSCVTCITTEYECGCKEMRYVPTDHITPEEDAQYIHL